MNTRSQGMSKAGNKRSAAPATPSPLSRSERQVLPHGPSGREMEGQHEREEPRQGEAEDCIAVEQGGEAHQGNEEHIVVVVVVVVEVVVAGE
jgi:hypothetical protein